MKTDPLKKLGARVRALRHAQNMTAEALAKKAGIATSFLSEIENGHTDMSLQRACVLALVLNTSVGYLAHGEKGKYR